MASAMGQGNSMPLTMSYPVCGWVWMNCISSEVSLPGLLRISAGISILPTSWISPARKIPRIRSSGRPLLVAAAIFALIWTWRRGRKLMMQTLERDTLPLANFIKQIHGKSRVRGTAVYMTSRTDVVPVPLLHNLKHNKVIHERIVLLHVKTENIPRTLPEQRIEVQHLNDNFHSVVVHYGFMEQPD